MSEMAKTCGRGATREDEISDPSYFHEARASG